MRNSNSASSALSPELVTSVRRGCRVAVRPVQLRAGQSGQRPCGPPCGLPRAPCDARGSCLRGTHPVHVLILEEKHVGVHAMLPELLHVFKPGSVAHCGDKRTGESRPHGGSVFCVVASHPISPPAAQGL